MRTFFRKNSAEKKEAACGTEIDIIKLAHEAAKAGLIDQNVLDHLISLNPQVPRLQTHEYLLKHLYNTINSDEQLFMRMVQVFVKFGSHPTMPSKSADCSLGIKDIPDIAEILVPYASNWRSIGTALRFKPHDLDNIQASLPNSPKNCLMKLLEEWLQNTYMDALRPTLNALEKALNSRLVGLGNLAWELRTHVAQRESHIQVMAPCYKLASADEDAHDVTSINSDIIQVEENTPCMIGTQVAPDKEQAYQWLINGKPMSNKESAVYTGITMPILCIPKADIDMDGAQYSCIIRESNGTYKTRTRNITLRVDCSLDYFARSLSNVYSTEVPEDTWPPVSTTKHINLALVKQEQVNYNDQCTRLTIRGDMDDILQHKQTIEYGDVFKSLKSKHVLFIEGRPGCGKTTFVHKITHDWAKTGYGAIRLVLLVSLRVLNKLNKPHLEIVDILNLFKDLKVTKQLLEERNGKGVCFIFDGLDEFSPPDGNENLVYKIIKKYYLTESTVVVASRPAAIAELRSRANKVIEVLGFPNEQILEYFDHYPFSVSSKAEDLKAYLSSHPNIFHMCYLPIHAAMVGFIFEKTGNVPITETQIYKDFTHFTILRSLSKNRAIADIDVHNLNREEVRLFSQICRLALEMTVSNKHILHQDEVESHFLSEKDRDFSLGLITVDRTAGLYGFKDIYTFLHLTFQEYLAAHHISTLSDKEQCKLIEQHGHKNHMLVVWKFYCGLVEFSAENKKFKSILDKTPRNILFHTQCAYESQQSLPCTLLPSTFTFRDKDLTTSDCTALGYVLGKSISPRELSIVKCTLNDKAVDALIVQMKDNQHSVQSLHFHLMRRDCTADSEPLYRLLKNLPYLRKLSLKYKNVDISYQSLADGLQHCTNLVELDLSDNMLGDASAEILAAGISSCDKLERINICKNKISNGNIIATLCRKSARLKNLDISLNKLGDNGAKLLASGLVSCSKLERIRTCMNGISVKGAVAIFSSIRQCSLITNSEDIIGGNNIDIIQFLHCLKHCTNLRSLEIIYNMTGLPSLSKEWRCLEELKVHLVIPVLGLGRGITTAVADYIQNHFHELRTILLESFIMDDENSQSLAEGLSQCPKLQVLDLSYCKHLETAGIKVIATSLTNCTNLEELYLNNCGIDSEGAIALSTSLHYYQNLRILGMQSNNIDSVGAQALADHLQHCTRLEKLDIHHNDAGEYAALILTHRDSTEAYI